MNIIVKFIGALLIIAGTTFFGRIYAGTYKERVEFLKDFNKRLELLKNEIGFMKGILADAIEKAGEFQGKSKEFFDEVQDDLNDSEAGLAWENACDGKLAQMNLKKEDIETIKALGRLLGSTDVEGQITNIEAISGQLRVLADSAEEERKKNEPLFKNIGPLAGVGIAVLLM